MTVHQDEILSAESGLSLHIRGGGAVSNAYAQMVIENLIKLTLKQDGVRALVRESHFSFYDICFVYSVMLETSGAFTINWADKQKILAPTKFLLDTQCLEELLLHLRLALNAAGEKFDYQEVLRGAAVIEALHLVNQGKSLSASVLKKPDERELQGNKTTSPYQLPPETFRDVAALSTSDLLGGLVGWLGVITPLVAFLFLISALVGSSSWLYFFISAVVAIFSKGIASAHYNKHAALRFTSELLARGMSPAEAHRLGLKWEQVEFRHKIQGVDLEVAIKDIAIETFGECPKVLK